MYEWIATFTFPTLWNSSISSHVSCPLPLIRDPRKNHVIPVPFNILEDYPERVVLNNLENYHMPHIEFQKRHIYKEHPEEVWLTQYAHLISTLPINNRISFSSDSFITRPIHSLLKNEVSFIEE